MAKYFPYIFFSLCFLILILPLKNSQTPTSPELSFDFTNLQGSKKTNFISASCGFSTAGHSSSDFSPCTHTCTGGQVVTGQSLCGGTCSVATAQCPETCANGATNYPSCDNLCSPNATQTQVIACSTGYTGSTTQQRTSYCPATTGAPVWNAWTTISSNCTAVCTPEATQTQVISCSAGYTGSTTQQRTSYCPTSSSTPLWNSWTDVSSSCSYSDYCLAGITPSPYYTGHQLVYSNTYFYSNSGRPTPGYTTGSCTNPLPSNVVRLCEVVRTTSDGSQTSNWSENYDTNHTTWTNQPTKNYQYTESLRVRCGYWNNTTNSYLSQGEWTQASAAIASPDYGQSCSATDSCSVTTTGTYDPFGVCSANATSSYQNCTIINSCGQTFVGFQCPSGCTSTSSGAQLDSACIQDFLVSSDNIQPDGSVKFNWSVANVPNVTSKCSFVDLTTATPRYITGLSNLDPSVQSATINNIQSTTRFCLVCQFFNLLNNNALLGSVSTHQWVRVQRVGEN
jgi:hypothetical protein